MADIFLSYASQDRERVRPLVERLEADGFSVWWDRQIHPGPSFDVEIEKAIESASCVVVIWSESAIISEWVRSEVEEGSQRDVLVPARIDDVRPPLAYRRRQTVDLIEWRGGRDEAYARLLAGVRATLAGSQDPEAPNAVCPPPRRRSRLRLPRLGPIGTAALLLVAVVIGGALGSRVPWLSGEASMEARTTRLEWRLPEGWGVNVESPAPLAITPDGSHLIAAVIDGSRGRVLVRPLASLEAEFLPGRGGWRGTVYSTSDNDSILVRDRAWQGVDLGHVALDGRGIRDVFVQASSLGFPIGAVVSPDGATLIGQSRDGILRIDPDGSDPKLITQPEQGFAHRRPWLFDEGRKLLYSAAEIDNAESYTIRLLDLATGEDRALMPGNSPMVTASGHLLFARDETVWGTAFDSRRGEPYGTPVSLLSPSWNYTGNLPSGLAISETGILAYVPKAPRGTGNQYPREFGWLDQEGHFEPIELSSSAGAHPRLSPDDSRLAFGVGWGESDVWLHDFAQGRTARLTFEDGSHSRPAWSPDGASVLYLTGSSALLATRLVRRSVDGTGEQAPLATGLSATDVAMTPDGLEAVLEYRTQSARDIARVSTDGSAKIEQLLFSDEIEQEPAVSPDGRWLAYTSYESGRWEVYVRPWPNVESGRWQVSVNGGDFPVWSRSDDRLFFVNADSAVLMAARFEGDDGFSVEKPVPLFDLAGYDWKSSILSRNFDVDLRGERIIISRTLGRDDRVVVVQNWFEELERLIPTER